MIFEFRTIAMCDQCTNWFGSHEERSQFETQLSAMGWTVEDRVLCPECTEMRAVQHLHGTRAMIKMFI